MFEDMSVVTFPGSKSVDTYGIVCFSHLRWNFVFQRPQHLLSRFTKKHPVLFIEEPMRHAGPPEFVVNTSKEGVTVAVPHLPNEMPDVETEAVLRSLVNELVDSQGWENYIAWYYTPMMLPLSEELNPAAVVYDCMDELSAFKNAPAQLREREAELFRRADLVFTGGRSLYEAKREQHDSVYCFPSSIDVKHFRRALEATTDREDQQNIKRPRIGFVGVIDERMDIELLGKAAELRPDWQFVMIGPVVKISEEDLPKGENIHYLGGKNYDELPEYIAGWDVAMMPFAINESTRFISPTKTPEYLAAGRPVVSTPIRDVVRPYGDSGRVRIAETAEEFVAAIDRSLNEDLDALRTKANEFLDTMSWDKTQSSMSELISEAIQANSKQYAEASVSK